MLSGATPVNDHRAPHADRPTRVCHVADVHVASLYFVPTGRHTADSTGPLSMTDDSSSGRDLTCSTTAASMSASESGSFSSVVQPAERSAKAAATMSNHRRSHQSFRWFVDGLSVLHSVGARLLARGEPSVTLHVPTAQVGAGLTLDAMKRMRLREGERGERGRSLSARLVVRIWRPPGGSIPGRSTFEGYCATSPTPVRAAAQRIDAHRSRVTRYRRYGQPLLATTSRSNAMPSFSINRPDAAFAG